MKTDNWFSSSDYILFWVNTHYNSFHLPLRGTDYTNTFVDVDGRGGHKAFLQCERNIKVTSNHTADTEEKN